MGFRDGSGGATVERRLASVERNIGVTLPSEFSWQITTNLQGEVSLNIVHVESGRIVMQGF